MIARAIVLAVLVASAAGCELIADIPSSLSSDRDAQGDDVDGGGGDDAGDDGGGSDGTCTVNAQCTMAAVPTCDQTDHACRACRLDAECGADGVCLLDGTCAAANRILYAAPAGSGVDCSTGNPCSLDQGVASLSDTKDVLKLAPATFQLTTALMIKPAIPVTVAGEGATLVGGGTPLNFAIEAAGPDTKITGVTVDEQGWYAAYCENGKVTLSRTTWMNGGLGFFSINPCDFTLEYSVVRSQIAYAGYFSAQNSTVHIRNSFITTSATNGTSNPTFTISGAGTTGAIENTTIAHNGAQAVMCVAGVVVRNVISFGNMSPPANDCVVSYSDIEAGYGGVNNHNVTMDPLFMSALDLHLQPTSPVRGIGDPLNILPLDIDLQVRPQTGATPDLGADEVP